MKIIAVSEGVELLTNGHTDKRNLSLCDQLEHDKVESIMDYLDRERQRKIIANTINGKVKEKKSFNRFLNAVACAVL